VGAVALLAAGGGAWIASLPPWPAPKGAPPIPEEETAAALAGIADRYGAATARVVAMQLEYRFH